MFTNFLFATLTLHENLFLNQIPWDHAKAYAGRECQGNGRLTRRQGSTLPSCHSHYTVCSVPVAHQEQLSAIVSLCKLTQEYHPLIYM